MNKLRNKREVVGMIRIIRFSFEYEYLKGEYFEWLEDCKEPLNLCEFAKIYKGIEIV